VQRDLYVSTRQIVAFFFISLVLFSCAKAKEEPETKRFQGGSSSLSETMTGEAGYQAAASATLPDQKSSDTGKLPNPPSRGAVIIGGDLGVVVGGQGAGVPARSSTELERQLLTFLPQLSEAYDQELTRDPRGMGSLDVKMTIEPNGSVSELRFPLKRMSSEQLTVAMHDVMRTWQFAAAEGPVDVRYRLLLVPPGMDPASIRQWERHLAGRVEHERSEKTPLAVPVTTGERSSDPLAVPATKETEGPTAPRRRQRSAAGEAAEKEERPEAESPRRQVPQQEAENSSSFPARWYYVTRPTALYVSPLSSAPVITRFRPGKHVWVIGIVGDQWLEVRSGKGRRPGFLPR
jgi:hypothetical protein